MSYTNGLDNPELYFQVALYTGNYSTQSITLDGSEDMQPDMVWIKERSVSGNHQLQDSVRGTGSKLMPNATNAESTGETVYITSFDSDGFSIGANNGINQSGVTNVAWCWKESATAGFDIVSYTGNGTDDTDISHNLSAVPKMIIVKNRDANDAWQVYHGANTSAPETDYMVLDTVSATADNADRWSDEAPTSSVFTLGDGAEVNTDTENYIAYCFAEKQGFSKFGTYQGNSSADGAFIWCGFKPAFIMTAASENTSGSNNWFIVDNKRHSVAPASGGTNFNVIDRQLYANLTNADDTNSSIDFLSNGFKWRRDGGDTNFSGRTFVYMAFAEAPFVNSNGVPCNAR